MRLKKRNILLLFFPLVFFFSLRVIFDRDLGLHLRVGEEIFKNRSPIFGNPLGLYFTDHPYVYHSWLSQLFLFLIYHKVGLLGLTFFYAFLTTAAMLTIYEICLEKGQQKFNPLFLAILTPFVVFTSGLRIRVITFLFLSLLYLLLLRIEKGDKRLALLIPPLFTLWANLHGGFLMGLIFLLLLCVYELIQFKLPARPIFLLKIFIASSVFCLLNPYGFGVFIQPLQLTTAPVFFRLNLDWRPLPSDINTLVFSSLFVLLVFWYKEKISAKDIFLFFCLFFLSILTSRFFLMLVLVSLPILVQIFEMIGKQPWFKESIRTPPVLLALGVFLITISFKQSFQIVRIAWAYRSIENYATALEPPMPFKAIKFIKEKAISEKMLNDFNWGSFLLWQLPERKIFVDGRMDMFVIDGNHFLTDYWQMVSAEGKWLELLEKYEFEAVFLEKTFPLVKILPFLPEWKKVYEDNLAVIVIKE